MDGEQLTTRRDGPVATISFDNPERHNALTPAMSRALGAAVADLRGDADVRVVVVRGTGDRAFMSGADIGALPDDAPAGGGTADSTDGRAAFAAGGPGVLLQLPQPVIALVHGWCLGGGLLTALCCDLRIAATTPASASRRLGSVSATRSWRRRSSSSGRGRRPPPRCC